MATIHSHQEHEARREANHWLEKQLTWEDRLAELRASAPQAASQPATPRRPAA